MGITTDAPALTIQRCPSSEQLHATANSPFKRVASELSIEEQELAGGNTNLTSVVLDDASAKAARAWEQRSKVAEAELEATRAQLREAQAALAAERRSNQPPPKPAPGTVVLSTLELRLVKQQATLLDDLDQMTREPLAPENARLRDENLSLRYRLSGVDEPQARAPNMRTRLEDLARLYDAEAKRVATMEKLVEGFAQKIREQQRELTEYEYHFGGLEGDELVRTKLVVALAENQELQQQRAAVEARAERAEAGAEVVQALYDSLLRDHQRALHALKLAHADPNHLAPSTAAHKKKNKKKHPVPSAAQLRNLILSPAL